MANIKKEIEKVYDECTELYSESGASAVIDHVNEQMRLNNPLYMNVRYKHCTPCNAEQPVLDGTCLVCGSAVHTEIGRKITTIGEVRELIKDCSDDDIAILEACDDQGDVEDLYPMYIDIIENIKLKDGKTVQEVRFCQIPNVQPEEKKVAIITPLIDTEKIEKWAESMSDILYTMRAESDLSGAMLTTPTTNNAVPHSFIESTVDDKEHIEKMKEIIRKDIVNHLKQCPSNYMNEKGEYEYQSDVYDFAYVIDSYIEQLYEDTKESKTVLVCSKCGSDNVQTKMWVNANTQKVIDTAGDDSGEDSWCEDCQGHHGLNTEIKIPRAKVIGYQVEGKDGVGHHILHPHMDASFCVYNYQQAMSMMDDNNNGDEEWQLKAIWTDDIEEPTMMFEGDIR